MLSLQFNFLVIGDGLQRGDVVDLVAIKYGGLEVCDVAQRVLSREELAKRSGSGEGIIMACLLLFEIDLGIYHE